MVKQIKERTMILPEKVYEVLKFITKCVSPVVTLVGAIFMAIGISESTTTLVLTIIGAVGTFLGKIVEVCKANWYKDNTEIIYEEIPEEVTEDDIKE